MEQEETGIEREKRERDAEGKREDTFCSMSRANTVRMCYMICYSFCHAAADCLAICLVPHTVTELL